MTCLLEERRKDFNMKELSYAHEFKIDKNNEGLEDLATLPQSTVMSTVESIDKQQAVIMRQEG
jgi:hypothetical protein